MKKVFISVLGLLAGLIVFMPKDNLYYTFQKYLSKNKIYINSDIDSKIALRLKNGTVYYKGMDIVSFDEADVYSFIFFNKIYLHNIALKLGNLRIKNLNVSYTVTNPLKVYINGVSDFGKIEGYVDLIKKEIKVYILNLNNNTVKRMLKKDKKGYFYYATFK